MIGFWDVVERCSSGEWMRESDYDALLYRNVSELTGKYDLKFDPESIIPSDDALADRAFEAGIELFLRMGFYCLDTNRVVRFTRHELEDRLEAAPETYVWGQGKDIHIHQVCNTSSAMLWLASVYSQALARNTHLLNESVAMAAAGPCTEMLFYEFAAYAIAATVSGANVVAGGIARDKYPQRVSTLEIQTASEVAHIVSRMGMKRKEANALVKKLLEKYERMIPNAPLGKKFSEIYDMEKVRPLPDYQRMYEDIRKELSGRGLDYGLL